MGNHKAGRVCAASESNEVGAEETEISVPVYITHGYDS